MDFDSKDKIFIVIVTAILTFTLLFFTFSYVSSITGDKNIRQVAEESLIFDSDVE